VTEAARRIVRLGHRGDGVAEDGTLAARTLPGEVVEGAVQDGRIAAPRILTPAPERVRAPCPHYAGCGGCDLMHAADGFVARWKTEQVVQALARAGLEAPLRPMHVSPPGSRRRAVLAGRRLKGGALVGFHARRSDSIAAIPDCRLLHPAIMAGLPGLEALVATAGSRRGELTLAVTRSDAGLDVAVTGGRPADAALIADLAALAEAQGWARIAWNGEVVALRAAPAQAMGRARVVPPPGGFLQATADGAAALVAAVRDAVGDSSPQTGPIADLFAGCGTFALPLAEGTSVHAVEADGAALAALDAGWRSAPGLRRVTTETRDLFRRPLLPAELDRFAAVAIDPPRAGAAAQSEALAASRVPVIAAVSCNPATFARDAAILVAGGYRLDWVQPVDQFRWSPHVELAARLSRPHMAG